MSFSIKFAPKISATAYGKITFNSNAANSTGTGTTTSQHSVSLSWNPSASAVAHYNVYRSGTSGGPYTRVASVPGTSYTRGAGGTVVLLRHYCRQLYREREQPFQPGARADSVIRHSGGMLRNRDPETSKAGQMPRFAYLSCVQVKRACETESPSRRKSWPLLKATMQLIPVLAPALAV